MNKRNVFGALLAMALFLVPEISHARWMNPATGRFQTMDSYEGNQEDPQSLHRYNYAGNDPVNKIDPSGNEAIEAVLAAISIDATLGSIQFAAVSAAQVANRCGTDVTPRLKATLDSIEQIFTSTLLSKDTKLKMSRRIIGIDKSLGDVTAQLQGAEGAWDIAELAGPSLAHDQGIAFTPPSGLDYGTGACWPSVAINGKAYYANAVNYAMWGKMFKLAGEFMTAYGEGNNYTEGNAEYLATARQLLKFPNAPAISLREKLAFTRYGYSGTDPSADAIPGAYVDNNNVTPSNLQNSRFRWCWEPGIPRSAW